MSASDEYARLRAGGTAIVRSEKEARAAIERIAGKPRNEEVYWCMGCGFVEDANNPSSVKHPSGLTLRFDEDEIEALQGDLGNYTGPCPVCKYMTLVPYDRMAGGRTIDGLAREQKKEEWKGQANAIADVFEERLVGSIFEGSMRDPSEPDLPDADDVDVSGMKARQ
jgi:hypothetical protein